MGQGGRIVLANGSGSNLKRTGIWQYQMNHWEKGDDAFPETLKAKESKSVYIEWCEAIGKHWRDDQGWVNYNALNGEHERSFRIEAHGDYPRRIEVYLDKKYDLGWKHDGDLIFVLTENKQNYIGTGMNASDWMNRNKALLGNKQLKEICIPGSHDSGMSMFNGGTLFATECNTKTQRFSVGEQLNYGVRYFDIRPVIGGENGEYLTGHYHNVDRSIIGTLGANGQSISSIINELNAFTRNHKELVILNLSHSFNTNKGGGASLPREKYPRFNQAEWDRLLNELNKINNRYYNIDVSDNGLSQLTLNDFTGNGARSSVVIIIDEKLDNGDDISLGENHGKGYFYSNDLKTYNRYSNKDYLQGMKEDQLKKMNDHSKSSYFILSWTLTLKPEDVAQGCTRGKSIPGGALIPDKSISDLAREANRNLASSLLDRVSESSYPNVIYVDYVVDSDVTAIAMAVNVKLHRTGYFPITRHRRTIHKPMKELTVSSAASAASPINHLASWIKEKSGTLISTIFNSFDQGIAKAAERFYTSPTLEGFNNPRDAETNPVKFQYNNGHLTDNVYLAKWLFCMFGNHAVVDRMNQAEQTLANNNDSISSLEGSKKQLRQGIATYGSDEEKTAFNAFEEKRSEKWMDRNNTTSAFFRSLPVPLCVANDSSLERPRLKSATHR